MNLQRGSSRRLFLQKLLAWSGYALFYPARLLAKQRRCAKTTDLALDLADLFDNKASANVVGTEYLRSQPGESSIPLLLERILPDKLNICDRFGPPSPEEWKQYLLRQRCEDFEHGRVVNVGGWALSQTEGRLCALVTLLE